MSTRIWPTIASAIAHASHTATAPMSWNPTELLLSRFSFGATPTLRAWVNKYGPDAYYRMMVTRGSTYRGYSGNPHVAALGPLLSKSPYDVRQWLKSQGDEYGWDAMDQLTQVTLGLQAWSVSQMYETMVDFFSNHLNVPNHNGDVWNTRHAYDRDVIRKYAMGSFTSMLLASAKHPAMLIYLNLAESTKTAVNENYGRELLELHTVGLHYSESDVKNAAKLLTGRTLDDNQHYLFDDYIHATGKVKILGFTHANSSAAGGEKAGDDFLRYLASHTYTANHLAQKMCVRFVSDTPSAGLVAAVAKAYLDNHTQIMPMVSTILRSAEFWQSRGKKVRRPAENVLATVRVLSVGVSNWADATNTLHWVTNSMGHCPLDWPAPNGYPDVAAAWRSAGTLLDVWNMHLGVVGGWWDGMNEANMKALYGTTPKTSGEAIDLLTRRITGMTFSTAHRKVLQTFLDEPASTPMADSVLRWWAQPLAAVILDSPHHALR
jgi:hypothetical protein